MDQMGKRIKRKREILGFQIKELSIKIGVTSSLISQIERGKAFPSIVTLKKIAEALNTKVGDLIGENENLVEHPLLKSTERRFVKENKKKSQGRIPVEHINRRCKIFRIVKETFRGKHKNIGKTWNLIAGLIKFRYADSIEVI